ncbi:MAG: 16S rRNA (adenine(1518)-N(6)/adenine(1519)-N(6))-dimethyltransferase RsmA [Firmicutes bacterium]|nr:16S rRNA (adenine(1518)-N(6)/adenine(1519)-N(6))-dimethyltransferase RsmA [Bacillota bacterium]
MTRFSNPSFVSSVLEEYGFRFKKRFGQNFLIDGNILDSIIAAAQLKAWDWVFEVGPGLGALTTAAAAKAEKVVAVEIDRTLVSILKEKLRSPNIAVIKGDALTLDWRDALQEQGWAGESLKFVANLPYYLTTPLIMKALEGGLPFQNLIVMVQKEVGQRMAAQPDSKDYGVLSLVVQYYTEVSLVCSVPRTVFIPAPKVDSAVLSLRPRPPKADAPRAELFEVIKISFQQRRKTVRNALKPLAKQWDLTLGDLDQAFARANLDSSLRGERLTLNDFSELTKQLLKGR